MSNPSSSLALSPISLTAVSVPPSRNLLATDNNMKPDAHVQVSRHACARVVPQQRINYKEERLNELIMADHESLQTPETSRVEENAHARIDEEELTTTTDHESLQTPKSNRVEEENAHTRAMLNLSRELPEQLPSNNNTSSSSLDTTTTTTKDKHVANVVVATTLSVRDIPLFQLRHSHVWDEKKDVFETCEHFLRRFERILEADGVVDIDKEWERWLPLAMHDTHDAWYERDMAGKGYDWKTACNVLTHRFEPFAYRWSMAKETYQMQMQAHETFQGYLDRFLSTARKARVQDGQGLSFKFFFLVAATHARGRQDGVDASYGEP